MAVAWLWPHMAAMWGQLVAAGWGPMISQLLLALVLPTAVGAAVVAGEEAQDTEPENKNELVVAGGSITVREGPTEVPSICWQPSPPPPLLLLPPRCCCHCPGLNRCCTCPTVR